eukprot:CAMPEP_0177587082 /NCGR_PEP_ID=MMETSP0419_2-20121207/5438_1 /TAXON_ID=582737 /ORGANISM="Tetraselmis sp., Strain GSL018" /LENGTH=569 /DNA_ID=CAMNT_0019077061 /DNA_START=238 /DNA_END=1946 /DNA_ORIENTATION=-
MAALPHPCEACPPPEDSAIPRECLHEPWLAPWPGSSEGVALEDESELPDGSEGQNSQLKDGSPEERKPYSGALALSSSGSWDEARGYHDPLDHEMHEAESISNAAEMFDAGKPAAASSPSSGGASNAGGRSVFEVLRVSPEGKTRRLYVKRRDLLRAHKLQPRDFRRIDPSLSVGRSIYSVAIREGCLLIALGGVRLIVAEDRALLFEPSSRASQKFLDIATAHLQQQAGARMIRQFTAMERPVARGSSCMEEDACDQENPGPPFELEMVEAALIVATGDLDRELSKIESRVRSVLQKLPKYINPVNLEELRSVKASLVDIESKADTLREVLEDLMDDEDEMREMNLSSRPRREERRRQRERERLERERDFELEREARRERVLNEGSDDESEQDGRRQKETGKEWYDPSESTREDKLEKWWEEEKLREALGHVENVEEAMVAAEEAMEEERELEQVEDMLDYYLQRAAMTEDEAKQMLTGARDLEESIGVSLSARRFEVNRLELTLSIGSFAAALGAMFAGIFGMNLRSTLEMSVIGFWGTTAAIVSAAAASSGGCTDTRSGGESSDLD